MRFSLRNKPANIMILILFIMFVSSLLGILVSQYVRNLIRVSTLFHEYYRGYYHAYAGLELGLAQTLHHGYGFEEQHNYTGFVGCIGGANCNYTLTIDSRQHTLADSSTRYADCANAELFSDYYSVTSGDGIIFPLFWDNSTGFDAVTYTVVSDLDLINMDPNMYNDGTTGEIYTIKVLDEDLENEESEVDSAIGAPDPYAFANSISGFSSSSGNKNYLIAVNSTGSSMDLCLQLNTGNYDLPSKYVLINSIGYYGDATVSLGAIKVNQLPSYLIYSAIE